MSGDGTGMYTPYSVEDGVLYGLHVNCVAVSAWIRMTDDNLSYVSAAFTLIICEKKTEIMRLPTLVACDELGNNTARLPCSYA